jgi:succinoglycan biosynthesis protein ExoA
MSNDIRSTTLQLRTQAQAQSGLADRVTESGSELPQKWPAVSIVIPTYNEAAHIEQLLAGFLQSGYAGPLEVLVVDGGSNDGTPALVERIAAADQRVRLLHNPMKIQSAALNIGIARMRGEIMIRADAHAEYASDYVERCVEQLLTGQALNVGGCMRFVAATPFQAGTAIAAQSRLAAGGSGHRSPNYDGTSDSVWLGCFWKRDLERLADGRRRPTLWLDAQQQAVQLPSIVDLDQVTNQDAELNLRLGALQPEGIRVSSKVKAWYYPRGTWKGLRTQYFRYGRGRMRTTAMHPQLTPLRPRLPIYAATIWALLLLLDRFVLRGRLHTLEFSLIGATVPPLEGLRLTLSTRSNFAETIWRGRHDQLPSLFERWLYCSVALYTILPSFIAGYIYQLVRRRVFGVSGW